MLAFHRKLEPKKGQKLFEKFSPVLIEATFAFNIDVLSPDGFESTKATRSFNVANHTHTDKWWGFDYRDSLYDFASASLGSWSVDLTDNVGHTGFEAQKGCQMHGFLSIILREGLDLTPMTLGALFGIESHGSMTGSRKFSVRL